MKRSFGGRPRHDFWQIGISGITENFIPVQKEGKTVAYCTVCKNCLKNISKVRLQMHRKNCQEYSDSGSSELRFDSDSESNTEPFIDNINFLKSKSIKAFPDNEISSSTHQLEQQEKDKEESLSRSQLKQQKKDTTKITKGKTLKTQNFKIQPFFDNISDKDQIRINETLMKFFCGCNVPFETVECRSDHFINLLKILRPAYKPPTKEMLSTSLLHNLHKQLIMDDSTLVNCDGILMVKETSFQNCKQIVTFVKAVQGKTFYLKSWDILCNLEEIINEALHIIKTKYSIMIYSVITDQDYQTLKISDQNNLWFLNCNLFFALSLEKILLNEDFVDKVRYLLVEFSNFKEDLLKRDGATIILSNTTACDDLHDMYASCKKNLAAMRQIIGENVYKLKRSVVNILFDETFEQELHDSLDLYGSIRSIIEKCENSCTTFADIVEDWLILESLNNNLTHRIKTSINKIITPIALAANFCHPNYQGKQFLNNKSRMTKMTEFFIDALDVEGLGDYEAYRSSKGIFGKLKAKECNDPQVFWNTVTPFHRNLAIVAIKLLQIPAAVTSMKTRTVHQNDLTPDRLQKLTDLYYNLKIYDKHVTNKY